MALGIDVDDGVVRTSMVHYNTHNDVSNLIKALKQI
jgi:selenocysteine lyase/cysteine desulfurase